MKLQITGAAKRLILSPLLACCLGGCAVYGPPYAAYDAGYAPAYGNAYPYYGGSPYAGPAYAYPPLSFDLGFSYYDRGHRYRGRGHGHHGWGNHGWGHRGGGPGHYRGPRGRH